MKRGLIFLLLILILPVVLAHQPEIIDTTEFTIDEPEISQAYYAELDGEPEFYFIESEEEFRLYVEILVPDIEGATTDYVVEIFKDGELIHTLEGEWKPYYEEHAGDDYFSGPEFSAGEHKGKLVDAGDYKIKVSSPDNLGKYALAVGDVESFPLSEIIETVFTVPKVKSYFGKPWYSAFETKTMLGFLGVTILIVLVFVFLIIYTLRLVKRKGGKK